MTTRTPGPTTLFVWNTIRSHIDKYHLEHCVSQCMAGAGGTPKHLPPVSRRCWWLGHPVHTHKVWLEHQFHSSQYPMTWTQGLMVGMALTLGLTTVLGLTWMYGCINSDSCIMVYDPPCMTAGWTPQGLTSSVWLWYTADLNMMNGWNMGSYRSVWLGHCWLLVLIVYDCWWLLAVTPVLTVYGCWLEHWGSLSGLRSDCNCNNNVF
jgi:hypothetical protein